MTKITTKTLSRYKSLFTVLLALLLLAIVAAPVSATINPAGGGNITLGMNNQSLAVIALNMTRGNGDPGSQYYDGEVKITLVDTTGVTFNTSAAAWIVPNTMNVSITTPTVTSTEIKFTVSNLGSTGAFVNKNLTNITLTGITVNVANTATKTNAGAVKIAGVFDGVSSYNCQPAVMVQAPGISVGLQNTARLNVTAGALRVPGPEIAVNSTAGHVDGEIGVGYIYVTLPSGSGITFDGSSPGVVATNTSALNQYGVGLTVTNPPTVVDGLTLRAEVTAASNTTSSRNPDNGQFGRGGQWVNFTGFKLNVTSAATGSVNFTIKTTPTGGTEVSQDSMGGVAVVKPSINALDAQGNALLNVTAGGFHIPGGQISINSTVFHPDGEIGNQTFIRITLPQDKGIKFDGSATVVTVVNTSDANTYGVGLTVNNTVFVTDYELKVLVTKGSNSTTSGPLDTRGGGQWVNFTGFKFNVSSITSPGIWNYTVYTQSNISLTQGTEISQDTVNGITVVKPNVTSAGVTVYLSGVENRSVSGGQITVNSTDLSPNGEIGNQTFIRIRIPTGKGITFNGSAPGIAVTNVTPTNMGLTVSNLNVFDSGLELNVTVTVGSNSTGYYNATNGGAWGRGGQWVNFTGFKLNVTADATVGVTNFTIYTQSNITHTLGAVIGQEVTGVTIQSAAPDTVKPVDPVTGGFYNNPIVMVVGTTATFNWTVYNNGTLPFGGKLINFATNGSASYLNTSSMTSSATGNVSVQFTVPTVISNGQLVGDYNLTATPNGYPLVVNTTNIRQINGTATKLRIFPDVSIAAPGKANITVWAQDQYGNNQTVNITPVHLSAIESDVTILNNDQPLLGGNFTFQIYKTSAGSATLTVLNYSSVLSPSPQTVQTFVSEIGSIQMTSPTGKYSLEVGGTDYTNLTVQIYGLDGVALALPGKTIGMIWANTTTPGYGNLTVATINAVTDSAGKAYFSAKSQTTLGTVWVNASATNTTSGITIRSDIKINLTAGAPAQANSSLTASPTAPNAGATSTLSALIRDSTNNPVSDQTVTFALTTPGGSLSNSSLVTNSAGYANVTLTTNTTAGTNTVTAISATGDVSKNVSVTTTAGTATKLGFTTDTPNAIGVGSTGSMKAQLLDSNGNLVAATGIPVNFVSSDTVVGTLSPASANTVNGVATVILTGVSGGTTVINASSTGLTSVVKTITVSAATGLTLTPDKTLAAATGSDTITVTLQLIDASGAPLSIAGSAIAYSTTSGTLSVTSGITGATGANVTTITSTTVGQPVITAQINGPSNTTTVTFSGNATQIVVTATPTTATINSLITVNVQAKDAAGYNAVIYNGLPITGQSVIYGYPAAITATNRTNFGATGAASATVTSATANTYTITATGVGKSGSTPVTFTIAPIASNVGVFRNGVFYRNGATDIVYGLSTDTPIIGNWDGTGDNAGVWRNNLTTGSSVFYLDGVADAIGYGIANDTPIVGDWNGDGKSEIGVWRSNISGFGEFYLRNIDGTTTSIIYGLSTDEPIIGDWNGDGMSEVGVWRSNSDGSGVFYPMGADAIGYGLSTDTPIVGDWNGDLTSEVGVWRNSLGSVFYRNGATVIPYGLPTDTPVIGKWA